MVNFNMTKTSSSKLVWPESGTRKQTAARPPSRNRSRSVERALGQCRHISTHGARLPLSRVGLKFFLGAKQGSACPNTQGSRPSHGNDRGVATGRWDLHPQLRPSHSRLSRMAVVRRAQSGPRLCLSMRRMIPRRVAREEPVVKCRACPPPRGDTPSVRARSERGCRS